MSEKIDGSDIASFIAIVAITIYIIYLVYSFFDNDTVKSTGLIQECTPQDDVLKKIFGSRPENKELVNIGYQHPSATHEEIMNVLNKTKDKYRLYLEKGYIGKIIQNELNHSLIVEVYIYLRPIVIEKINEEYKKGFPADEEIIQMFFDRLEQLLICKTVESHFILTIVSKGLNETFTSLDKVLNISGNIFHDIFLTLIYNASNGHKNNLETSISIANVLIDDISIFASNGLTKNITSLYKKLIMDNLRCENLLASKNDEAVTADHLTSFSQNLVFEINTCLAQQFKKKFLNYFQRNMKSLKTLPTEEPIIK